MNSDCFIQIVRGRSLFSCVRYLHLGPGGRAESRQSASELSRGHGSAFEKRRCIDGPNRCLSAVLKHSPHSCQGHRFSNVSNDTFYVSLTSIVMELRWYALLYYLYTGKVTFLPPKSARTPSPRPLPSSSKEPKCLPNPCIDSQTRSVLLHVAPQTPHTTDTLLQVGLEDLRNGALQFLRNNITEQNVLKELTSSLVTRFESSRSLL